MDTVVVTGADGALGRAIATAFAERDATVVLGVRNPETGESFASELDADVQVVRADPRDEFDIERLMEQASRAGDASGIDVVVPSEQVYHGPIGETPLTDTPYSAFDDTMRTNARGVFAAIAEAIPHLTSDARVLVPTGDVAQGGAPGYGAFAVSAAATEAVVRGFSAELDDAAVVALDVGTVGGAGDFDVDAARTLFTWAADQSPETIDGERLTAADVEQATA